MSVRGAVVRTRAVVGIAFAQLRRSPGRTTLAVLAVALAVLSVTLLASLGVGVAETGEDGLDSAGQDIWLSSDPVDPSASGTENPVAGAHATTSEIADHEDVTFATPIAMHEVYVERDGDTVRTSSVGVHYTHDGFGFEEGGGFETDVNVTDEASTQDRSTDPETAEIVLHPETAETLGVSVGETVTVGTSHETASDHEFTVVGIAAYYSQYLGTDAQAMPLFDQQAIAGSSGTDRATFITASVADDADAAAVAAELDAEYDEYDVRPSDEQVGAMFEERPLVLASGATLVALAFVGGLVLTVNLFALVTYQQREQLAALRAIGLSRWVLAGTIGVQGLVIGLLGGVLGLAATLPLAAGLSRLAAALVGFEELLQTPPEVYAAGLALALVVGTLVALVTGWRAGRYARIEHLEG
ncbi:ABC transporter permease [Halobacteria archaeon AArc-dxtr1]|nr:ABC transporter permease [Halobacteria archaeon AArc-dxtr1]